ncbi:hypothetical protein [Sulfurimonas sp.]|uniref:hypothetical protein n=1 Tax=Sulfurimonas sp. TaxID=2022749 RepID=UPI00261C00BD|nr:hypothetical protein [Sulfurimonas sp.]
MKTLSHKLHILKTLLDSDIKLTATDFSYVSNANQYFCELELQGLIKSEWGKKGKSKVKLRYVPNELREKASKFLSTHIKSNEADNGSN